MFKLYENEILCATEEKNCLWAFGIKRVNDWLTLFSWKTLVKLEDILFLINKMKLSNLSLSLFISLAFV